MELQWHLLERGTDMKTNIMISLFYLCTLTFELCTCTGCTNPISPANGFALSVADVSCTEAWLNLHINTAPAIITINKNGAALFTMKVTTRDTTIYDSTLSPGKNYTYQALVTGIKSNQATVRTLDTTSHDFTWQTFSFGANAGSCTLYDCTIVNDTLAYAVGEIYLMDSTGQPDPQAYNLAVWNGKNWKLQKLNYQGFPPVIHTVFAFNAQDIWFDPWFHWDGQSFQELSVDPVFIGVDIRKMWGNEKGELYVVGNNGSIAFREKGGYTWNKIKSGTNNNISDVWGNTISTGGIVYCVTHDQYGSNNSEIISIKNNQAAITPFNEDDLALTIWTPDKNIIYVGGGNGLFKCTNNNWKKINYNNSGYVGEIRGNADNDFFISGGFGLAAHFNGSGWKVYDEISLNAGNYYSVSMKGNLVVLAGYNYDKAVIALGRRN
jgi:hypothetical protein